MGKTRIDTTPAPPLKPLITTINNLPEKLEAYPGDLGAHGQGPQILYKRESGGHVETWQPLPAFFFFFFLDRNPSTVVLPVTVARILRRPTYGYLRASLRVGLEPDEVEAVVEVAEAVSAHGEEDTGCVLRRGLRVV